VGAVETVQLPAEATLARVAFALAGHESAYYLRLRTYKACAPATRVRVVGPFGDGGSARAAGPDLIRERRRALVGALPDDGAGAADGPARR
jgi:hypothetical protein